MCSTQATKFLVSYNSSSSAWRWADARTQIRTQVNKSWALTDSSKRLTFKHSSFFVKRGQDIVWIHVTTSQNNKHLTLGCRNSLWASQNKFKGIMWTPHSVWVSEKELCASEWGKIDYIKTWTLLCWLSHSSILRASLTDDFLLRRNKTWSVEKNVTAIFICALIFILHRTALVYSIIKA